MSGGGISFMLEFISAGREQLHPQYSDIPNNVRDIHFLSFLEVAMYWVSRGLPCTIHDYKR